MQNEKIKLFYKYNKRPVKYSFNQIIRWVTIILACFALIYAFIYIFTEIGQDSNGIKKIFPFIIILLAFNSIFKNIFSLNKIKMFDDRIEFHTFIKKTATIYYSSIKKIKFEFLKTKYIEIQYEKDETIKKYKMILNLKKMTEIVNNLIFNAPNAEYDQYIENVLITEVMEKVKKNKSENLNSIEEN